MAASTTQSSPMSAVSNDQVQPTSDSLKHDLVPEGGSPISMQHIQLSLKTVIDLISKCQARHSIELLSQIMDAIATHCEPLGLSPDPSTDILLATTQAKRQGTNTSTGAAEGTFDRLHFWQGLNDTWLFAIQCSPNYSSLDQAMTEEDWNALKESVVAWSDVLEWYGLVDYEMGFWEDDIVAAIQAQIVLLRRSHQQVQESS